MRRDVTSRALLSDAEGQVVLPTSANIRCLIETCGWVSGSGVSRAGSSAWPRSATRIEHATDCGGDVLGSRGAFACTGERRRETRTSVSFKNEFREIEQGEERIDRGTQSPIGAA